MLQNGMLQRGNYTITILIAVLLGGVACFLGYTILKLESGTKSIQSSNEAAFRSHTRKLEIFELRLLIARMYESALTGALVTVEGQRSRLNEHTAQILRKYNEIVSMSGGDVAQVRTLNELDPHLQAMLSLISQSPRPENLERWRDSVTDIDRRFQDFANQDDAAFKDKLSQVAAALNRESNAVHTMQTLGIGVVACALLALAMYLLAAIRPSRAAFASVAAPAASDLRYASFAPEERKIARRDPDMRRYRDDFVASFQSRMQELDTAIRNNPADLIEPAQFLADAAATHNFDVLSAAAASLHVAARAQKSREELQPLLGAVRKAFDDIHKSIL